MKLDQVVSSTPPCTCASRRLARLRSRDATSWGSRPLSWATTRAAAAVAAAVLRPVPLLLSMARSCSAAAAAGDDDSVPSPAAAAACASASARRAAFSLAFASARSATAAARPAAVAALGATGTKLSRGGLRREATVALAARDSISTCALNMPASRLAHMRPSTAACDSMASRRASSSAAAAAAAVASATPPPAAAPPLRAAATAPGSLHTPTMCCAPTASARLSAPRHKSSGGEGWSRPGEGPIVRGSSTRHARPRSTTRPEPSYTGSLTQLGLTTPRD